MDLLVIIGAVLFLVQILLIAQLHRRLVKVESLIEDVLMDVTLYDLMKKASKASNPVSRTINTVGRWKK